MKIKKIFIRAAAALMLAVTVMAFPVSASSFKYDFPSDAVSVNVTLDGKSVLVGEAAIINSVTYIPLRSFAELLGAESISWDQRTRTATVKKGNTTIKISDRVQYVEASGRFFYSSLPVRNIDNRIFVPIRVLCSAFCVDVKWNDAARRVELTSTGKTLEIGESFYDKDDLYWLSRIISAEAGGESLKGKIAVGNVVLNRVGHRSYPNTIYGVIFDRKGGTQFTPVASGTIYKSPTAESVVAAKICLEGFSIDENILFFMNPRIATNNWISKNRPFAFRVGNHSFYY